MKNTTWNQVEAGQIVSFIYKSQTGKKRSARRVVFILAPRFSYRKQSTGRVVDFKSNTTLRLVSVTKGTNTTNGFDGTPGSFQTNEALTVSGGDPTSNSSAVSAPDLKAFEGDIIYVENRSPVSRASDQIEDVKLIINF